MTRLPLRARNTTQTAKNSALCIYSGPSRQIMGGGRDAGTPNAIKTVSRSRGDFGENRRSSNNFLPLVHNMMLSTTARASNQISQTESVQTQTCVSVSLADNTHVCSALIHSHAEVISTTEWVCVCVCVCVWDTALTDTTFTDWSQLMEKHCLTTESACTLNTTALNNY